MYDERKIRRVADGAVNKRQDRRARIFATFCGCFAATLVIAFSFMLTYVYNIEEAYVTLFGFIFGQCSWGVGMTVYYAIYEKRRYKF